MAGLTFYGFHSLIGYTVSAFVCGLDCQDYVVAADGSITVPYQSDPDGLFTAAYAINLAQNLPANILFWGNWGISGVNVTISGTTYNIPVAIGCTYTSQGQILRPDEPAQGQNGPGPGKTRRNHWIAAKLVNAISGGVSFGSDFGATLKPAYLPGDGTARFNGATLFSGVYQGPVIDGPSFDGMISWQITRPLPCTVTSVSGFIDC